jgi:hypothetical protein
MTSLREKQRAQKLVRKAVLGGELEQPERCERCKAAVPLQAHHEDYDKPLDVVWLCTACHVKHHQDIGTRPASKSEDSEALRSQPFALRVVATSRLAYKHAADQAGLTVSEWARLVLDSAAGVSKLDEQLVGRVVFYVDVGKLSPREAMRVVEKARKEVEGRKVRDGKW